MINNINEALRIVLTHLCGALVEFESSAGQEMFLWYSASGLLQWVMLDPDLLWPEFPGSGKSWATVASISVSVPLCMCVGEYGSMV